SRWWRAAPRGDIQQRNREMEGTVRRGAWLCAPARCPTPRRRAPGTCGKGGRIAAPFPPRPFRPLPASFSGVPRPLPNRQPRPRRPRSPGAEAPRRRRRPRVPYSQEVCPPRHERRCHVPDRQRCPCLQ
ncbi:KEAP1 isoform 2, partial [Pan troglodytes]